MQRRWHGGGMGGWVDGWVWVGDGLGAGLLEGDDFETARRVTAAKNFSPADRTLSFSSKFPCPAFIASKLACLSFFKP